MMIVVLNNISSYQNAKPWSLSSSSFLSRFFLYHFIPVTSLRVDLISDTNLSK